ncbi:hypothetical protein LCGC14_2393580 [marine sediment metagenome]|uniref:Uncharacterized protein n=1 Tax=marine sediment metagenome TaxID=412755 RepID=A0A0F9BXI5_9ZZZZ
MKRSNKLKRNKPLTRRKSLRRNKRPQATTLIRSIHHKRHYVTHDGAMPPRYYERPEGFYYQMKLMSRSEAIHLKWRMDKIYCGKFKIGKYNG